MATRDIRDSNGRLLNRVHADSTGKETLRDANGRLIETYDPRSNTTRDANGRLVVHGRHW